MTWELKWSDHAEWESDGLQLCIILNNGLPELHNFGVSALVDYRGDFETRLGRETGRSLLIRPDGYVAFDIPELDADHIADALQTWIIKCPRMAQEGRSPSRTENSFHQTKILKKRSPYLKRAIAK